MVNPQSGLLLGGDSSPLLSIIVPVYNEAATIREVLKRIVLAPFAKEIIVVEDGSTDGTVKILEDLDSLKTSLAEEALTAPFDLKVLSHPRNRGKGAAIRTAQQAVAGEITLIQDADFEYDPAEYPKLLQPILDDKADVVYGSRFQGSPRRVLFFWHTIGNQLLTLISNMFTNLNLTDLETGYKAFRTEVFKNISLNSDRFEFEPEVTAKVAKQRLRIYEVPISYSGRTYQEGKKIRWKDGLTALWAILRYNLFTDNSHAGEITLQRVHHLSRYNTWIWQQIAPFIGQRILEVGAGIGTMTRYLLSRELILATDINPVYLNRLKALYSDRPNVVVQSLDLSTSLPSNLNAFTIDTILCLNVLEHIQEDEAILKEFRNLLPRGGRVVLVVPALKRVYGAIDKAIGHYRRYEKEEIEEKLQKAGFQIEETRFFNTLGVPGWYFNSCVLKRQTVPGFQARVNDLLVPLLKLESRFHIPWGMSLLAVGKIT